MIESTEPTCNIVETSPLSASASQLSTVSEESQNVGGEEAQTCNSNTTINTEPPESKMSSEPPEKVRNRRCFTKVLLLNEFLAHFYNNESCTIIYYITQDELLSWNSGRPVKEEECKLKILELFKLPREKLDNSLTYAYYHFLSFYLFIFYFMFLFCLFIFLTFFLFRREGLYDPERQVITAEPYMYKPHSTQPASSTTIYRSGVQPLMQLTPFILPAARSYHSSSPRIHTEPPPEGSGRVKLKAELPSARADASSARADPSKLSSSKRVAPGLLTPRVGARSSNTSGRAKNAGT